jgi:hypothetical protein
MGAAITTGRPLILRLHEEPAVVPVAYFFGFLSFTCVVAGWIVFYIAFTSRSHSL